MYALLGDIRFTLPTYLEAIEQRKEYNFAEHALIEGQPRLQWIGDGLKELRKEFVFNWAFCNPEEELKKLHDAAEAHRAMPLVYGNGTHAGVFVITGIQSTVRQTDGQATLIAITVSVTLREWVADETTPQIAAAPNEGRTAGAVPIARQQVSALQEPAVLNAVVSEVQKDFGVPAADVADGMEFASKAADVYRMDLAEAGVVVGALNEAGIKGQSSGTGFVQTMTRLPIASKDLNFNIARTLAGGVDFLGTVANIEKLEVVQEQLRATFGREGSAVMAAVIGKSKDLIDRRRRIGAATAIARTLTGPTGIPGDVPVSDILRL